MEFKKFEDALEKLGGQYRGAAKCLSGQNQFWKFPETVELETIYLTLDANNDSFFQDFEVTHNQSLGGNTKIFYKFLEQ